jgi:hypothetical protein
MQPIIIEQELEAIPEVDSDVDHVNEDLFKAYIDKEINDVLQTYEEIVEASKRANQRNV